MNPDQYERSLVRAMPLAMAAEACSRIPKCRLRPVSLVGLEVAGAVEGEPRLGRGREVGRAAEQPGHGLGQRVEHLARRVAAGDAPSVGRERREGSSQPSGRSRRCMRSTSSASSGYAWRSARTGPPIPHGRPGRAPRCRLEGVVDALGDEEILVLGHAEEPLGRPHPFDAERLAVGLRRVLDGRAVADVAVHEDQGGPLFLGPEGVQRALDRPEVVGVGDRGDVPAVGDKAGGHVLGERDVGVALDGHPVGVVDPAQVGQAQVAGQRGRLRGDALHHAAVAGQGVDVEVEERVLVPVVALGQPRARDGHPDGGRHPLAQRPGGGLDPARPAVLGMARAVRIELAEPLQVVEGDRGRSSTS